MAAHARFDSKRNYASATGCLEERGKVLNIFRDTVGSTRSGRSPMKILLLGTPGVGKSSLINTCITSITQNQFVQCADVGPGGQPVTRKIIKYSQDTYCMPYPQSDACLPTFIDMAGLEDEDSEAIRHILQMACAGKLPEGTEIVNNPPTFRPRADLVIDRIIFVAAADQNLPKNLIESTLWASKHCGKVEVPVFGVLSKVDLMKFKRYELQLKMEEMQKCFNCTSLRLAGLRSYVPNFDFRITIDPNIDYPVIEFLIQVCNPAIRQAVNLEWKDETLTDTIFQFLNEIKINAKHLVLNIIMFFVKFVYTLLVLLLALWLFVS